VFIARAGGARQARAVVRVSPLITLDARAAGTQISTRGGLARSAASTRISFSGSVSPASSGARVALQVEYAGVGERWRTVAFTRVAPDGSYSVAHHFRRPGEVSVRTRVHVRGLAAAASAPLTLEIVQAQSPQLTIEASADPVLSGSAVTVSGVTAGAPSQHVALLARVPGHPWTVVAEGTTDEHGGYSFTQTPLQNTGYRARTAAAESATLFEGVQYPLAPVTPTSPLATGEPVTFSGTVSGAPVGKQVRLERQNAAGTSFHVIGSAAVDATSAYSIPHTFQAAGTFTLRVQVPADQQTIGTTSPTFTITVTGP
jgi:hypothetical protein